MKAPRAAETSARTSATRPSAVVSASWASRKPSVTVVARVRAWVARSAATPYTSVAVDASRRASARSPATGREKLAGSFLAQIGHRSPGPTPAARCAAASRRSRSLTWAAIACTVSRAARSSTSAETTPEFAASSLGASTSRVATAVVTACSSSRYLRISVSALVNTPAAASYAWSAPCDATSAFDASVAA